MTRIAILLLASPLLLSLGGCGEASDSSKVTTKTDDGPRRDLRPADSPLPRDLTTPKNIPMH